LKRIGMEKKIQLDWLDKLAFLYNDERDAKRIKEQMDGYLSDIIKGGESRRKHINVLMRIWVSVPEEDVSLRDQALQFLRKVKTEERLALHWGLCLLAYPLFRDVTTVIGRLLSLQDEITLAQVHKRIIESWGDRSSLNWAVQRLLRSLSLWGALKDTDVKGEYVAANKIVIENEELKLWLLECYLRCIDQRTITYQSLISAPALFPFDINVKLGELLTSDRFEVNRQGLDVDVVELR